MIKYIALIILMAGCATKPAAKPPEKPSYRGVKVNVSYSCPVSAMDDFHRGLHSSSQSGFSH